MNEFLLSIDPKIRTALLGLIVMLVTDTLGWRTAVRKAELAGEIVPAYAWDVAVLKWAAGFLAGFGLGTGAEVVTPPEVPPVVMDAVRSLLA